MLHFKTALSAIALLALTACGSPESAAHDAPQSKTETKPAAQEAAPKAPEVKVTDLGGGLYMLVGRGGNLGISIGDDGVVVIDDQFENMAPAIKGAIAELTDQPVRFLVNTHFHGDHSGGNEAFIADGTTIVAHHNVHKRLNSETTSELFGRTSAARPDASPQLTYSTDMVFHLNGQEAQLIHTPNAHTDGDTIIYFATADVLHMGDNYFNGLFPYIDTGAGGNVDGMIAAHQKALALAGPNTKIIPGHGPLATKADLKAANDMLIDVRARVAIAMEGGKSVDEVVAMDPLKGLEQYESFINKDNMVRSVYFSLD